MNLKLLLGVLLLQCVYSNVVLNDKSMNRKELENYVYNYVNDASTRATACDNCNILVESVQQMTKSGKSETDIFAFVMHACTTLHIDMPHVCDHIIKIFGDELIFVLNNTNLAPANICNTFIATCGSSTDNPVNALWNFTIPGNKPPVKPWPVVPKGKPTLRVLHLSDIHIDANYSVGSEADCTYEWFSICCRDEFSANQGDVKAVKTPSGTWGMPNHCDIPQRTFENAIQHIAATEKNIDYIIITGDLEAHDMWEYSQEYTKNRISSVNGYLKKYFGNIPIFNSIGNHEGVPGDAMAPHNMIEYSTRGPQWLYASLADSWRTWLPDDTMADIRYRASYAVRPFKGLKLISVNTVYCSHFNFYVYLNVTDPDDTMQWITEHLLESERLNEKVHIISHIPSGSGYCLRGWAHSFYDLVNRFENTIAGQFYGHTHQDHFEVYYENANPKGRPTHVNMIAPSLTTYAYNNPAYRIYTLDGNYDGSSFTALDYETYYLNLTETNASGTPVWKHEYTIKDAYGMPDLSPASFNDLINRMESNVTLFEQYYINYRRNDQYEMKCVEEAHCRAGYTCATKSARSYDKANFCS